MHERSCRKRTTPAAFGSWLLAAVLLFGAEPPALPQGGPPMLTDDPGTPGPGAWEINVAYLEQRTRDEQQLRSFPHIDVNYGLGERIQLKYETGWSYLNTPETNGAKSGLD